MFAEVKQSLKQASDAVNRQTARIDRLARRLDDLQRSIIESEDAIARLLLDVDRLRYEEAAAARDLRFEKNEMPALRARLNRQRRRARDYGITLSQVCVPDGSDATKKWKLAAKRCDHVETCPKCSKNSAYCVPQAPSVSSNKTGSSLSACYQPVTVP